MTKAFLEPTVINKKNLHLFMKVFSKEHKEKVKQVNERLKKEKVELEKIINNKLIEDIMKHYE